MTACVTIEIHQRLDLLANFPCLHPASSINPSELSLIACVSRLAEYNATDNNMVSDDGEFDLDDFVVRPPTPPDPAKHHSATREGSQPRNDEDEECEARRKALEAKM